MILTIYQLSTNRTKLQYHRLHKKVPLSVVDICCLYVSKWHQIMLLLLFDYHLGEQRCSDFASNQKKLLNTKQCCTIKLNCTTLGAKWLSQCYFLWYSNQKMLTTMNLSSINLVQTTMQFSSTFVNSKPRYGKNLLLFVPSY